MGQWGNSNFPDEARHHLKVSTILLHAELNICTFDGRRKAVPHLSAVYPPQVIHVRSAQIMALNVRLRLIKLAKYRPHPIQGNGSEHDESLRCV